MADIPTFTVAVDYDIGQVTIELAKSEWGHPEDHDEALLSLEPLALGYLHQPLLERTLDALRASIHAHLLHRVHSGELVRSYSRKWIWAELEQERRKERGLR